MDFQKSTFEEGQQQQLWLNSMTKSQVVVSPPFKMFWRSHPLTPQISQLDSYFWIISVLSKAFPQISGLVLVLGYNQKR